jgi:hypothetical protein
MSGMASSDSSITDVEEEKSKKSSAVGCKIPAQSSNEGEFLND